MAPDQQQQQPQQQPQQQQQQPPRQSSPQPSQSDLPSSSYDAPYLLRPLFRDVPLSADGAAAASTSPDQHVKITCVDYLDGNLYVGTSAAELLHFVQIPPDPADPVSTSAFILASRLKPAYSEPSAANAGAKLGVHQILLLPKVGKACILCNWTVTFYSLPELSPVFGTTQVKNCSWIGGVDLNEFEKGQENDSRNDRDPNGITILLSLNRRIQVVRIGEDARVIKKIDFASSQLSLRRESIACVADSRSYALLEVERQLKIPLMSISSLDRSPPQNTVSRLRDVSTNDNGTILRAGSPTPQQQQRRASPEPQTTAVHRRVASIGDFITGAAKKQESAAQEPRNSEEDPVFQEPTPPGSGSPVLDQFPSRTSTPQPQLPRSSMESADNNINGPRLDPLKSRPVLLKPHIVSPTPEEFLLVTGTAPLEPGIGMFVNLDGDPTRPTIEFDRYPKDVVVDGRGSSMSSSTADLGEWEEGYVLATMGKELQDGIHYGLEIQRWDQVSGESRKHWLELPQDDAENGQSPSFGIRSLLGLEQTYFREVVDRLCQCPFKPFTSTSGNGTATPNEAFSPEPTTNQKKSLEKENDSRDDRTLPEGWETKRAAEEEEFAKRLAASTSRLAVWSGSHIWWALRNPLLLQLDAQLDMASSSNSSGQNARERQQLFSVLQSFRNREAKSELEFLTFNYIRQRAGVLLLQSFLQSNESPLSDQELRGLEQVLIDSQLDPRVVLSLIPGLRNEVIESRRGMWIFGGVQRTAESYIGATSVPESKGAVAGVGTLPLPTLQFLRRFLAAWRRRKGLASIPGEKEVFRTVDAALLAVLLELDRHSPPGIAKGRSVRSELYDLVDNDVDCFDRATHLTESYHRLYVLSRLYQSRKMAADVLTTWRRIVSGDRDDGAEFRDGELRIKDYLMKLGNHPALVQEHGLWLANRNPKLGVQVFAEEGRSRKVFEPAQVVALLREHAPDAVKYYLEFLVFHQGHTEHVNELITYYLDIVVQHLQSSPQARETVLATYAAYRALRPLKPSYRQFLTDNTPPGDEVWESRLRLLQLIGGTCEYDVQAVRKCIAGLAAGDLLVPETIILDGRERKHENALRLLVHHLGDYDTAVAYCVRGGESIYSIYQAPSSPSSSAPPADHNTTANGDSTSHPAPPTASPQHRQSLPPTQDLQARLFRALLSEFLALEDGEARIEQTGILLDRFGGFFELEDVLDLIPDDWTVDVVVDFLVRGLRRLVGERHETGVARGLSSSLLLRAQYEVVEIVGKEGPRWEGG